MVHNLLCYRYNIYKFSLLATKPSGPPVACCFANFPFVNHIGVLGCHKQNKLWSGQKAMQYTACGQASDDCKQIASPNVYPWPMTQGGTGIAKMTVTANWPTFPQASIGESTVWFICCIYDEGSDRGPRSRPMSPGQYNQSLELWRQFHACVFSKGPYSCGFSPHTRCWVIYTI